MSSVSSQALSNSASSTSSNPPVDQSLLKALYDFQEILDPDQKKKFLSQSSAPDASAAIILTTEIDNENAKRRSRCVAARILSFLESVQQFCSVVETFVSSNPKIAALVWGSVKFVMLTASNISSYFDKLSSLLMNLRNHFPRYSKYQTLYSQSTRLQAALCEYYAITVGLCKKILEVGQRSGFVQAATSLLKPFEIEFGEFQTHLAKQNSEIEKELDLAEREAAALERKSARISRRHGSLFRRKMETENEEAHEWRKQVVRHKSRKKRQALLEKLSSYEFKRAYKQACRRRHGATGLWIQQRAEFETWCCGTESSVFWCSGIPGSGKTVLTAGIIGELFRRMVPSNVPGVRFFFCEYDRPESLKAATILSSLIRQCLNVDNMSEKVEKMLESLTQDPSDSKELLERLFYENFATPTQQCIVIDAIDEIDKKELRIIMAVLQRVLRLPHARLKLFLTGGPHIGIELNRFLEVNHHLPMTSSDIEGDIRAYIKSILAEKMASGELVVGEPHLVDDIQNALVKGAEGMFLWVAFQIQDICSQKCDEDIRTVIGDLPSGLTETYERALHKISKEKGTAKWAQKIFRWAAAARQPLTLQELREAIAIKPGQTSRNPAALANDINQLLPCCRDLVILDEEEKVVQFAHHTIKKFLLNCSRVSSLQNFHFELSRANHEIGEICVTYLNFKDLKQQVAKRPSSTTNNPSIVLKMLGISLSGAMSVPMTSRWLSWLQWARVSGRGIDIMELLLSSAADATGTLPREQLNSAYALLPYASKNWLLHSSDFTQAKTESWSLWVKLLHSEDSFAQVPWTQSEWLHGETKVIKWIVEHEHCALLKQVLCSTLKYPNVSEILLESTRAESLELVRVLINSQKFHIEDLGEALQSAADRGNLPIVNLLLSQFPSALPFHTYSEKSLAIAAAKGYLDVTKRLLDEGISPDAMGDLFMKPNPLLAAVDAGHDDVANLLLDAGATVSYHNPRGPKVPDNLLLVELLKAALYGGHHDILNRILGIIEHDKETRPPHPSALAEAVKSGDIRIVDMLLKAGAHVNARALSEAINKGHLEIVDRLLEAGADISLQYKGLNALQLATHVARPRLVSEKKVPPGLEEDDPGYDTFLDEVIEQDEDEMVNKLREQQQRVGHRARNN